ncbi:hypothetical protein [Streptococcus suis]
MNSIKNKIEYRKSQPPIAWILIYPTILTFLLLFVTQMNPSNSGVSSDLETRREQVILESNPMTISSARAFISKTENETEVQYIERLQEFINKYNESLESRKSAIRREKEIVQSQNGEFLIFILKILWGITAISVVIALISNYLKSRQPIAIVVTGDYIEFKAGFFRGENRLYWDKVATIEYRISYYRGLKPGDTTKTRYLYFKDINDTILDKINLSSLEISDFNIIQRDISNIVPSLNWVYP